MQQQQETILNISNTTRIITLDGLSNKLRRCLNKKKVSKTSQTCSICMNQFNQGDIVLQLPCKHIFHNERCIKDWFLIDVRCPMCRYNVKEYCLAIEKDKIKKQK